MTLYLEDPDVTLFHGDVFEQLALLPDGSVQCCVTSPPYWGLRDYGVEGQIGLEATPDLYVARMVEVFREVRRVLRADGTLWLNLGDSYASNGPRGDTRSGFNERYFGSGNPGKQAATADEVPSNIVPVGLKPKDLVGIPWRVAFALQADGWYLRSDIVWAKPNPMPESVTDRPTKSHEYVFLLSRSPRYFFDQEAVREPHTREWFSESVGPGYMEPWQGRNDGGKRQGNGTPAGRNVRSVWEIATQPYPEAHFATFPEELVRRCILAGCPAGGVVLDPFAGSGTTGLVARKHGRRATLIELNADYCELASRRLAQQSLLAVAGV